MVTVTIIDSRLHLWYDNFQKAFCKDLAKCLLITPWFKNTFFGYRKIYFLQRRFNEVSVVSLHCLVIFIFSHI